MCSVNKQILVSLKNNPYKLFCCYSLCDVLLKLVSIRQWYHTQESEVYSADIKNRSENFMQRNILYIRFTSKTMNNTFLTSAFVLIITILLLSDKTTEIDFPFEIPKPRVFRTMSRRISSTMCIYRMEEKCDNICDELNIYIG